MVPTTPEAILHAWPLRQPYLGKPGNRIWEFAPEILTVEVTNGEAAVVHPELTAAALDCLQVNPPVSKVRIFL